MAEHDVLVARAPDRDAVFVTGIAARSFLQKHGEVRKRIDGARELIRVRKLSYGVGVERLFPVHSPMIEKIELAKQGKVRRAKLYFLRELRGKAARIKEKERVYASVAGATQTDAAEQK